jgi:DNA-binding winged helix-turn-helix (wHTH) protein
VPVTLCFGPFELDERSRVLKRDGERVPLSDRHALLLLLLTMHAGEVISKDALVTAGWADVAVTDNSVEQAISTLRRTLGTLADGNSYIETIPRRGYRFAGMVSRAAGRETDESLEALLAPHRRWLEGRAALETLERDQVAAAERAFAQVLAFTPDYAPAHVGLANACTFRFESTRADEIPDLTALAQAEHHAREACRLDAESAEAWATLALIRHRARDPLEAVAAARRAVALEPGNWRHHLRLAVVSWGEQRLRAAARSLQLLPGLALAHWLAASVHVARQAFDAAERELEAGTAAQDAQDTSGGRFGAVGLHWLRGLVRLQSGDEATAREGFQRELGFERKGHLYARECCANTWYAIGALHARHGEHDQAIGAFDETLRRVSSHVLARAAKAVLIGDHREHATEVAVQDRRGNAVGPMTVAFDAALAQAVTAALAPQPERAAALARVIPTVHDALASSVGDTGWLLPVEPLLAVGSEPDLWAPVLALVRIRAA